MIYISLKTPNGVQSNSYIKHVIHQTCIHLYNVKILNLFGPELQLKDKESAIKNKLKELLSKLKKFKVQTVLLVVGYKKRNDRKIFHSCTKVIASDSGIDNAFISMHQTL